MKKVIAAIVLISLLTVAIVQAMEKKNEPQNNEQTTTPTANGLKIGAKAPDFELKTLTGETVKLSSLKGKKVMLNFWATWCPPCKAEMPEMEKFYQSAGKDIVILAVNIDPQNDVKGFADKNGITFPILLDEKDHVNQVYQILSIPTTYFIDSNGTIQNKFTGGMNLDMMKKYTSELK
ncbi:peroxiredoxin family protein [Neobacillus massiliamazoniensis]|uniref:peroxiredoxin family protein n=1 Tax=Neobacillus massiliamazoniensis TaxID=1499688 RepID=UPI003CCBD474